jgi:hypothetical protein
MRLRFPSATIALVVAFALNACGGGGGGGNATQAAPSAEVWKAVGVAISIPGGAPVVMPEVVVVSPGLFRMYFGQGRTDGGWDIWYAESSDGLGWTVRGIALAGTTSPSDPEFIIRGASMVHLASGQWRMYYQAAPTFDQNASRFYFQTMSAISNDGVTFTREGVRIANHHFDPSPFSTRRATRESSSSTAACTRPISAASSRARTPPASICAFQRTVLPSSRPR